MQSGGRAAILLTAVVLGGIGGWSLIRMAAPAPVEKASAPSAGPARPAYPPDSALRPTKTAPRSVGLSTDEEAEEAGALRNQRTIRFSDRESLERFLAAIEGRGISVMGSIDRLNLLRVGFLSLSDLESLLDGDEELGMIFPVSLPQPANGGVQPGAVGFGRGLLDWLGVTGDHSSWGAGVKVAILDTGVTAHSLLGQVVNHFLVEAPANQSDWNGHGTAVASLIQQLAPSAELLSWRVADDSGMSNSFLLAQAILEAVDAGANVINISMGSNGSSSVLNEAIRLAHDAGVLIVASAGNDGHNQVSHPAANDQVVGVGAVDAKGEHLLFSNTGDVSLSAPGLDLLAAWTGNQSVYFSGTSGSAPVTAGLIAAVMTAGGFQTPAEAFDQISRYLNDTGPPGPDELTGAGIPNIARILRGDTPGYFDAAVTANHVDVDSRGNSTLQVTVQNQGTEPLVNTLLEVSSPSGTFTSNVTTLLPGQTHTFMSPLPPGASGATIHSNVQLSGGAADMNPANNQRTDVYSPPAAN